MIKKTITTLHFYVLTISTMVLLPGAVALADGGSGGGSTGSGGSGGGSTGSGGSGSGSTGSGGSGSGSTGSEGILTVTWQSPLNENVTTIESLILIILNTLVIIAVPIVVLMIIYAGFMYVTARGNAEQVKKATTALTYAIIGGILVIGAVAITGIIEQTVGEFTA